MEASQNSRAREVADCNYDDDDVNLPPELDRKLPAIDTINDDAQLFSAEEQLLQHCSNRTTMLELPPPFVHVPNINIHNSQLQFHETHASNSCDIMRRTPSVPDLISHTMHHDTTNNHYHGPDGESMRDMHHHNLIHPHLFINETRLDKKEQFEERLRRAHLRIRNSDAGADFYNRDISTAAGNAVESSEKRYRSKSTPSRGIGGRVILRSFDERQSQSGNLNTNCSNESSTHNMQRLGDINIHVEFNEEAAPLFHTHDFTQFDAHTGILPSNINNPVDAIISFHASTNAVPPDIILNFSSTSYDGSGRHILEDEGEGDQHTPIEPPPLPPPATEKERLVERERQARLESERARRRYLALQRERQREEDEEEVDSGDDVIMNGNANGGLLGQVSFDAGLQLHAPNYVGDSALVLGMQNGSFVGSLNTSIPIPPIPPPATERERLVERERQARLETERARRRQALLRERHLEESDNDVENDWINDSRGGLHSEAGSDVNHGLLESPEFRLQAHETNEESLHLNSPRETIIHAQDPILPLPMERFLENTNEGGSSLLHIDSPAVENDSVLPYTMELFLAEHAIIVQRADSGGSETNENKDHNINGYVEPASRVVASINQESLIDDVDDDDIQMIQSIEHVPMTNIRGIDHRSENSWISHEASSSPTSSSPTSHALSQDLFDTSSLPRLTEADIAQLAEVEHASTGNAAPQSVRDEPSEPSVVGRGAYLDHAFSVATQTTMLESVTEASACPLESAFSDINESVESLNVYRVGSVVSISTSASDGASSASVEAMPSRASSDSSHSHSVVMGDELSQSEAPGSHSSYDDTGIYRLTEAVIVTQAEIDCASIGNSPPHSIRDDRLSESSITERVGRQSMNISTRIGEHIVVGDLRVAADSGEHDTLSNQNDNASVEAMPSVHSDHSIEEMPSEQNNGIRDLRDNSIMYHPYGVGSSASIEALPSIDQENDGGFYDYEANYAENIHADTSTEMFRTTIGDNFDADIETTPLLSSRRDGQPHSRSDDCFLNPDGLNTSRGKSAMTFWTPSVVLVISEIPAFIIIAGGNEQLLSVVGLKKLQMVLASIVMTSILNHADKGSGVAYTGSRSAQQQQLDRSFIFDELQNCLIFGMLHGFFIGSIGLSASHLNLLFGVVIAVSAGAAIVLARLCKLFIILLLHACDIDQSQRLLWIEPMVAGFQDFICCLVVPKMVCVIYSEWPASHDDL